MSKVSAQFCNTYYCFSVVCEKKINTGGKCKEHAFSTPVAHTSTNAEKRKRLRLHLLLEIASAFALNPGTTPWVVTHARCCTSVPWCSHSVLNRRLSLHEESYSPKSNQASSCIGSTKSRDRCFSLVKLFPERPSLHHGG